MSAVCEDLEPLVEDVLLLKEQDVPAFKEAEAALLGGRVVAAGSGQDGPFPLVLQLPDVGAEGGPHLPASYVTVVPGNPLFGGVDGDAPVVLLFGGGQRGRGRGGRGPCSCTSRCMIGNIERTESWSQVCYTWRQSRIV